MIVFECIFEVIHGMMLNGRFQSHTMREQLPSVRRQRCEFALLFQVLSNRCTDLLKFMCGCSFYEIIGCHSNIFFSKTTDQKSFILGLENPKGSNVYL